MNPTTKVIRQRPTSLSPSSSAASATLLSTQKSGITMAQSVSQARFGHSFARLVAAAASRSPVAALSRQNTDADAKLNIKTDPAAQRSMQSPIQRLKFASYSGLSSTISVFSSYTPEEETLNALEKSAVKAYNRAYDSDTHEAYSDGIGKLSRRLRVVRTRVISPTEYETTRAELTAIIHEADVLQGRILEEKQLHREALELHTREEKLLESIRNTDLEERERQEIESQLDAINIERRELIRRTLAGGHRLWLPPSVAGEDQQEARNLWSSISQNKGNVQVDTDAEFRLAALSDISKLLQSKHGRTLLGNLNRDPAGGNRTIEIAPGEETDNAPKGTPKDGHIGEGSRVSINYSEPGTNSMGTREQPIYDPTYIKLGHELGHASHYLAGTASSSGSIEGVDDPFEQFLWTNQEEYNNITGEENPLRRDLGLDERKYHEDFDGVLRFRIVQPAVDKLNDQYRRLDLKDNEEPLLEPRVKREADRWLSENNEWSAYKTSDLNIAVNRAEAAMQALEEDVARIRRPEVTGPPVNQTPENSGSGSIFSWLFG